MPQQDYLGLLEFSNQWLHLGLLTEDELSALGHEYAVSDDKNTEHYRYGVFRRFVASHRPLSSQMAEALYELGQNDPDPMMGGAMMHDIVDLMECPDAVLEKATASGKKHLVKAVKRRRLLTELDSGLTEDLFARCLASGESPIQRALLEKAELSQAQLAQLAIKGSNRAVRNMASERLSSRRYTT